ncbi:PAS domain S-box protein [bacterium]|nr:PAS domain S-box protein [bacterium]
MPRAYKITMNRIVPIYLLFGGLWIFLTDWLTVWFAPQLDQFAAWQTIKGMLFVLISGLLIYWLLLRKHRQIEAMTQHVYAGEARYRLLFENNPLAMWVYDLETLAFLDVNQTAIKNYGYSQQEFLSMTICDVRPPEDVPLLLQNIAATQSALNSAGEWRHKRRNGTIFPVEIISHTIQYSDRSARLVIAIDISERKQLQAQIEESEQRFRSLMEQSPLGISIYTPDGTLVEANAAYFRLLGLSPAAAHTMIERYNVLSSNTPLAPPLQSFMQRTFNGESLLMPLEKSPANIAAAEGEDAASTARMADKAQHNWFKSYSYALTDTQGKLRHVVMMMEDVTEQHLAREAMKKSQDRFEQAFRYHPTAMEIFDVNTGESIDCNQQYQAVVGYSVSDLSNAPEHTMVIWADPEVRREARQRLIDQRQVTDFPAQFMTRAGGTRDFLVSAHMLDIDGSSSVIASYVDVTERNQAEKSLRQLKQAIEQSSVSVVITDAQGKIEYVNPKFCELTGYSMPEVIGETPRILRSGIHAKEFYRNMWQQIKSGQIWQGEICNRKKNNQLFWEQMSIASVKDDNGKISHYVAVREDITDRKRLVEEHNRQERLAAVGQLAAGIAHDFNNILGVVVIYAQMLHRAEEVPERFRERAGIIHQQAKSASALIQQILDFSRRSGMERQPLDLLPFLKEQVKLLERTLPENILIQLHYDDELYMLNGDPGRLQQVITNLAINARDAMPNGGTLDLTISMVALMDAAHPPIVGMAQGPWIKLTVADSGIGMSRDVMAHIFEPFFSTKERGRGTGLGLAQVYGIVKQHEGHIKVTSLPGAGATFELYFPCKQQPDPYEDLPEEAHSVPQGNGQRILLVEDDEMLRAVLSELLANWQYEVLGAANGVEALSLLARQEHAIALILCDLVMPEMGGEELLVQVQQHYPNLPVIFMTGHLDQIDTKSFNDLGLKTWLPKPLDIPVLAQIITDILPPPPYR